MAGLPGSVSQSLLLSEQVRDEELALVDDLPRLEGDEEDDGPLDLHAALAQIESSHEGVSQFADDIAGADAAHRSSCSGKGAQEQHTPCAEPDRAMLARCAEVPVIPCDSWFAVGGIHDMDSPLVRVANDDLQEAALRGDLGLVRRLIHANASVNAPMRPECDDEFMSLLHVLALKPEMLNGSRIMAEVILHSANLNVRSSLGSTPLAYACLSKHIGAVEVLLEARADTSPMDDHGRTAVSCAVLPLPREAGAPGMDDMLAAEAVQLLASWGTNLDDGGDLAPLVHAVRQRCPATVVALLSGGASPEGLHEAVETAPRAIIQSLVRAEANPFTKDATGRTVMDIALARGDEEVTTLLRNFIGDLQRQQHKHLRTLEVQMREDEEAEANRSISIGKGQRRSKGHDASPKPLMPADGRQTLTVETLERLQTSCRRVNRHKAFQVFMFMVLLAALFLPDVWILLDIRSNDALDVLLLMIVSAFVIELLVQVIGLSKSYTWTFSFWMDVVGILSVPLDHSLVVNALPLAFDNAVVARVARMAKLGARAGRFTKVMKLLRYLPGFQEQRNAGTAKVISRKLNLALSTRVSMLIILMVMVVPLFELVNYPTSDFSMKMWVDVLGEAAQESPRDLAQVIADVEEFYSQEAYFPFEAHYTFANGSVMTEQLSRGAPVHERSRVRVKDASGATSLTFNFKNPQQVDALCNCLLVTTIMVLMMGSGLVLTNSVSSIVLVPLEELLSKVQQIASKIFSSVTLIDGRANREEDLDEDEGDAVNGGGIGNETQVLEKVLKKLTAMSEITTKRTMLDVETLDKLEDGDRAVLQGYGGDPAAQRRTSWRSQTALGEVADEEHLLEALEQRLAELGIWWEDFDSWDFNILELIEPTQCAVCVGILTYHWRSLGIESPSDSTLSDRCTKFVEAVASGYGDPQAVPYHNFCHAVDVTFTTFQLFIACRAAHFLTALERLALSMAAIGHDLGHPGLNNPFLVETSHELALRYNDRSPLENMHCARLFELANQESSAVMADLQRRQQMEVRRVCIEAVLHTDIQRHAALVKETQALYEMNGELFDVSDELYRTASIEFPAREVADFFQSAIVKEHLHHVLLHFCDISNPLKARPLCEAWADRVVEEFFRQGDREKELSIPVQALNDRTRVNKASSQMGFIEFFVAPLAYSMARLMPPLDCLVDTMLENLELWFDSWADESSPRPDSDEKAKVRDRIAKLIIKCPRQGNF